MSLPSSEQLKRALALKERIEALETELNQLLGTESRAAAPPVSRKGKRRMSAAGRAAISAAAKARWAKTKGMTVEKVGKRRTMSAAGRARIAAAARKRWKLAKAAGKNRL
jgi:hypothetical protein